MDKPIKPTSLIPRSFGGEKYNFSDGLQEEGYRPDIAQIVDGGNLNYLINSLGQELSYSEAIADFITNMGINQLPIVDGNNKLAYINKDDLIELPLLAPLYIMRLLDPDELLNWTLAGQFATADDKPVLFEKVQGWFTGGTTINDTVQLSNINNNIITATIPCVKAQNGARIVHIDNMASIDTLFTNTGSAAYLVYDPSQSRVRLPRNNNFISGTDNSNYVNNYEFDAINNITGEIVARWRLHSANNPTFAGALGRTTQTSQLPSEVGNVDRVMTSIDINSSRVVNTADKVRPRNISQLLYFRTR